MHTSCLFKNIHLAKNYFRTILIVNQRTIDHIAVAHLQLSLNKKLAPYFDEKKKKVIYISDLKTCRECVNEIKRELGEYVEKKDDNKKEEENKENKEKKEKKEKKEYKEREEENKENKEKKKYKEREEENKENKEKKEYKGREEENISDHASYRKYERFQFMGLDIEGYKLGKNGIISIIQICTRNVYLFDLYQCNRPSQFMEYLKEILENEKIIKITHDCREDCSILYNQYRVNVTNIFDTQIAHNIVLKKEQKEIYQISYDDLLLQYLFVNNNYKVYFHKIMKLDNKVFLRRPISNELIQYAVQDVLYLKPLMCVLLQKLQKEEENLKKGKESSIIYENEISATSSSSSSSSLFLMKQNYLELDINTKVLLNEVIEESKKYISYKFLNDHITNEKKLEKGMSLKGMVVSTNHIKIYVKLNLNRSGVILNSFNYKCEVGDIIHCVILGFSGNDFINLAIHPSLLTLNGNI